MWIASLLLAADMATALKLFSARKAHMILSQRAVLPLLQPAASSRGYHGLIEA